MITLIQFPKALDRLSYSPFCLKMETYLKVAQIPYKNEFTVSTSQLKKRKLPAIVDQGTTIEDSMFIIQYLKEKHQVDLDRHLTNEQKAIAQAFQWLCEKSIVDIIVHFRWCDPNNWPKFRDIVFKGAPWFIKLTIANIMAKSIAKTLYKHGMGRFTDKEKLTILEANLKAISDYLGAKKYFFGDQVSAIDVILFSHLVQVQPRNAVAQFKGTLEKYPNLMEYLQNFTNIYWPEVSKNQI